MKGLYKLSMNFGKNGELNSLFIADSMDIDILLSKNIPIYFGEVLGKYSDIISSIQKDEIKCLTFDSYIIEFFEKNNISIGTNPFYAPLSWTYKEKYFADVNVESVEEAISFFKKNKTI